MNCDNCGAKLNKDVNYCSNCGAKITSQEVIVEGNRESTENIRVASIVLGGLSVGGSLFFILTPLTLILGIIGLILAIKSNRNSKNTVGIVLNSIGLFISFVVICFISLLIRIATNIIRYGIDEYGSNLNSYIEEQWNSGREQHYE